MRQAMPGRAHYDQACATCHEGQVKKAPHREMIGLMTPEAILAVMETGIMRQESSGLTAAQRTEVAEYLAGAEMGADIAADLPACPSETAKLDFGDDAGRIINWGLNHNNDRHVGPAESLAAADLARLAPRLAIRFPGANRVRSQPTYAGNGLFVGSHGGQVYALDSASGCAHWAYAAAGEVRTGIVFDGPKAQLYFGDVLANVYALNAHTGAEIWRARADEHPNATLTGTPAAHGDLLYAPVSALEVSLAVDPAYECCTFRGSVVAYATADGTPVWRAWTIDEPARPQSRNRAGTIMRGPSGAVIWNAPTIDVKRSQLYVATGENMSSPATLTSDAIFAMDMRDGAVKWVFQATENDVWNVACDTENDHSCPPENGPDFDFGAATMLLTDSNGRDLVIGGQKSGWVHALDPDTGGVVWQTRVGRGGIQGGVHFGMAAAGDRLFVPISDMADGRSYDTPDRPGLHALDIKDGKLLWYAPIADVCRGRAFCHPGISQAITSAGDLVYAGGMDGVLRVHDAATGAVLREIDSTAAFTSITGDVTRGGSFGGAAGPIIHNGELTLSSGYGIYNHMPGNLLLVLAVADAEPDAG